MEDNNKMTVNKFAEAVAGKLTDGMDELEALRYTVETADVTKNNGIICHGITIRDRLCNVAPTIYVDKEYEDYLNGVPLETCTDEIREIYEANKGNTDFSLDFLKSFEETEDRIYPRLINAEKNEELLKEAPHALFGDLAVTFHMDLTSM